MNEDTPEKPSAPDLPKYIREPLESSSPERLDRIASFASGLAAWRREQQQRELEARRAEDEVDEDQVEELEERGLSTDPDDHDDVPSSAYVTVKETKPGYHYYYFQWREGDSWKNEYIAPVNPKQ